MKKAVVGAMVAGIFLLLAAWLAWYLPHHFDDTETSELPISSRTPGVTTQIPEDQGAVPIQIDPVSGPVKRCASFSGSGDVPEGRHLWIVVRTNEAGQTKYYFNEAFPAAGRWTAPKVSVGSETDPAGILFPVLAVTFGDATNQDISSGQYQNGAPELFADASQHDEIGVELGTDRTPCSL